VKVLTHRRPQSQTFENRLEEQLFRNDGNSLCIRQDCPAMLSEEIISDDSRDKLHSLVSSSPQLRSCQKSQKKLESGKDGESVSAQNKKKPRSKTS